MHDPGGNSAADLSGLVDHLFRHRSGRITASLIRVLGFEHLNLIEDVIQDAMLKALKTWPYAGVPKNPAAWLTQVARNRAIDVIRRHSSWTDKRRQVIQHLEGLIDDSPSPLDGAFSDDQLQMVFACCHPDLPAASRVALTLKAVGGFSVAEIARAFLAKQTAMAQRLVRAKRQIRALRIELELPAADELPARLDSVLQVIYLMFNEGYGASQGDQLIRQELCFEALRLAQCLLEHARMATPRVHALLALIYLQSARLATRVDGEGDLILLAEQDRGAWDQVLIHQGVRHLGLSAAGVELSKYHLEAEISACHTLAPDYAATDWNKILECYELLQRLENSAVIAVNRAVALLHVEGAHSARRALDELGQSSGLEAYYPYHVTRAMVAGQLGCAESQQYHLRQAMQLSSNAAVKRFLIRQLATES